MRRYTIGVLVGLLAVAGLLAQSGAGAVHGIVIKAGGAVVPGVTVRLSRPPAADRTTVTNARGEFSFSGVVTGRYVIRAVLPGFDTASQPVEVAVGGKVHLRLALRAATAAEHGIVVPLPPPAATRRADSGATRTFEKVAIEGGVVGGFAGGTVGGLASTPVQRFNTESYDLMTIKIRYKDPDGDVSTLMTTAVGDRTAPLPALGFAAAVAEFGMLLRDSEFKGSSSFGEAAALAQRFKGADPHGHRAEFIRLIGAAEGVSRVLTTTSR